MGCWLARVDVHLCSLFLRTPSVVLSEMSRSYDLKAPLMLSKPTVVASERLYAASERIDLDGKPALAPREME